MTQDSRIFYVYAFLREKDSAAGARLSPYYIGKGCKDRAFAGRRRIAPLPARKEYVVFIQEGLTEEEAFDLEKYCIAFYGRISNGTGILRNFTDGGEGASGMRASQETRKKLSEIRRGRLGESSSFWGKKHSNDAKRKMSESKQGEKHPFFGKQHSQESKEKMSAASRRYCYELVSPDGIIHTVEDARRFTQERGLDWSHLFKVISGKRSHHKGWTGRILEPLK